MVAHAIGKLPGANGGINYVSMFAQTAFFVTYTLPVLEASFSNTECCKPEHFFFSDRKVFR